MPANGSSSSMNDGREARARAISQRRRSPPESASDGDLRSRVILNSSSRLSSCSLRFLRLGLDQLQHRHDVLLDRQAAEDRGFLRQVADAEAGAAVHGQPRHVAAVEGDAAGVGGDQAGDHVEHGGLAGAVGTEQADRLAAAAWRG